MKDRFIEGYKACIADLEVTLNASIKRNNGARTFRDGFNVMNDVVIFTHTQELRIDAEVKDAEEKIRTVFILGGM